MPRSPLAGRQPKTKLSRWLREKGISSDQLAFDMKYSRKAIDMWRAGYRNPGVGAQQLLCMRLKISRKQLLALLSEETE